MGCKNLPENRHLGTISQLCWATSSQLRHISTIGKKLLSSNISSTCPHNMVNFSPLAAEVDLVVWGTPANFNGFRILAAFLHGTLVLGIVPHSSSTWTYPLCCVLVYCAKLPCKIETVHNYKALSRAHTSTTVSSISNRCADSNPLTLILQSIINCFLIHSLRIPQTSRKFTCNFLSYAVLRQLGLNVGHVARK